MHVPKRRTLAITIYRYRNLDLAVTIAENIREKKASWYISSNIEQFVEKLDLKIELVLFLYILSTVFL